MNDRPAKAGGEAKRRGRKPETPQQRLERLQREMEATRRAIADAERARLVTIGTAVLAEAEANPSVMEELRRILRARVTTKAGKEAVAALLVAQPAIKAAE
ncbi:hypothetical protein [Roseicella aquatilis]|uniref:Mobilization protein n=1 Tax=Roseicella aquatilis TaxID=2527868 RepID=A0A4R4D3U8_9PROT|nr:hypothetical protein [Roseicella aquatilis]TCZ51911.1 hypothetical protein EXY23_26590 [Roseicella aquatilis]